MHVEGIGIDYCRMGQTNHLVQLENNLADLYNLGYRIVEFGLENQNLIINGEIRREEFNNLKSIFQQFNLKYTIHGYLRLNLAYDKRINLCRKIMATQIQFCKEIGASRLVIHSGLDALSGVRYGVRQTLLSDDELKDGALNEVNALIIAAEIAADAGVIICVENIDPHLWEINLLKQKGASEIDWTKHHARLMVEPIIHQLERVNHPNVGMTLDLGHLFLSSQTFQYDYLSAIKKAAPWVKHLHLSDNFGNLDSNIYVENERWAFGEADMHMPPTWGAIPFRDAFSCLPDYSGYAILEIGEDFKDYFGQALETVRQLIIE